MLFILVALSCDVVILVSIILLLIHSRKSDDELDDELQAKDLVIDALRDEVRQLTPEVPIHSSGLTSAERFQRYVMLELCQEYNLPRILGILQRFEYLEAEDDDSKFIFSRYNRLRGEHSPRVLVVAKDSTDEAAKKILLNIADNIMRDPYQDPPVARDIVLGWFGLTQDDV
jgi:hypothetical protein